MAVVKNNLNKILIGFTVALAGVSVQSQTYHLTDLGSNYQPVQINNSGMVAGVETVDSGNTLNSVPFIWQNGSFDFIGSGGPTISVRGMNGSGQVLITDNVGSYLYSGGSTEPILSAGMFATGISDTGELIGWDQTKGSAFAYSNGVETLLSQFSSVSGVNKFGQIVGQLYNGDAGEYCQGLTSDLGDLASGTSSFAQAVSSSGSAPTGPGNLKVAVGGSEVSGSWHAVIFNSGSVVSLATVGQAQAFFINGLGQVGGSLIGSSGFDGGFVWSNGKVYNVNSLLDPSSLAYSVTNIVGSNDEGQLIGYATLNGVTHGFVLTPNFAVDTISAFSVSPSTIVGGNSTTGTVTLSAPAPSGGYTVTLTSANQPFVSVPATVVVPAGMSSTTFPITTKAFGRNVTVEVVASDFFSSKGASVLLVGNELSSFSVSPSPIVSGQTATGTLTLSAAAPSTGWSVSLVSANPSEVSVPSTVTIPSGQTSTTFPISTTSESSNLVTTISATDSVTSYHTTLTTTGDKVSSVTLSPSTVLAGGSSSGTVTLASPAPVTGWPVTLISANKYYASVPATVVVPSGSSTVNFTITAASLTSNQIVNIGASDPLSFAGQNLFIVTKELSSVALNPTSVIGGSSSTGTVTLFSPAPSQGYSVSLASGSPSIASVPSSVTVPAGKTSAIFTVSTTPQTSTSSVSITASDITTSVSTPLSVMGDSITSVALNPTSLKGGASASGTVTLSSPAPTSGWTVNLLSANPSAATVVSSIKIASGASTGTFTVSTVALTSSTSVNITASDAGSSKSASLGILGDSVQGVSLSPSALDGGISSTGTVTLTAPAPAGGWTVNLASGSTSVATVGVSSVTIPAGSSSTTFTVTTSPQTASTSSVITASDSLTTKSATLTVYGDSVSSVTLSPTTVTGGKANSTGTVTLTSAAPIGGWTVTLSANSASGTVPASVTVAAGSKTATFTVSTSKVTTNQTDKITGSDALSSASATLVINASSSGG